MKHAGEKITGKRKDRLMTMILVCVFLSGLAILLYPTVSNWWNARVSTRAVAAYEEAVTNMSGTDYTACFEAADKYNQNLANIGSASVICNPALAEEDYWEILDITGTGVMGYITIDKIDVQLPIYHGTDAGVLQIAAGHLEGSSLPVGGESTHCVISAHRGLPSARLFTDLDQLEAGDIFTVTVLDRVLTYEVDQIFIIEPDEIENLYIEEGKDYCTLMTCTPYGVNSHRLLVRGVRTENASDALIKVSADASKVDTMTVASVVAVPILLVLLVWLSGSTRRKRHKEGVS